MTESNPDVGGDRPQKQHFRSTISFPYSNLEEVAAIAKAIYEMGGVAMTRDQIANILNSSPDSSTFSVKLSSARMFGVLGPAADSKLTLTDIGIAIAGEGLEAVQARVDAFLSVELYQRLVEHFQGKKLPPAKGLEAAMVAMGVSARQGEKARAAFEKSASYAGYFNTTKDRLVAPIIPTGALVAKDPTPAEPVFAEALNLPAPSNMVAPKLISGGFDPLIEGMLQRLPTPGSEWPMNRRVQWLRTLAANLSEVYLSDVEGDITVRFEKQAE
jgi:hypothetical protein